MVVNLNRFTHQLEQCRRRWNRTELGFVLTSARIFRKARASARNDRRWVQWMRDEVRVSRCTVHRHLKVADFVQANVALKKHFALLSMTKLYILSKLDATAASRLVKSGRAAELTDIQLRCHARELTHAGQRGCTLPNLLRSTYAVFNRMERVMARWNNSGRTLPFASYARLLRRLKILVRTVTQLKPVAERAV